MKPVSIRLRLVLSYVALTVLTVSLVGVLALSLIGEYIRVENRAQLLKNAEAVARQASGLMQPVPQLRKLRDLASSVSYLGQVRVRILDANSHVFIDSGAPNALTSVLWVQPDPGQAGSSSLLIPFAPGRNDRESQAQWLRENFAQMPSLVVQVDEGPWGREIVFQAIYDEAFVAATPDASRTGRVMRFLSGTGTSVRVPIGDEAGPQGFVQLDNARPAGGEILAAMRRSLLLAGLGASLIALIAGLLISRSLTAPIQALAESATRMSSGDLSARAPVSGAGEIGQLARQFNQMADHLQASFAALSAERDALRRFIADASHELRTPITALSSFIELLQGPAAGDPAAREEFLTESAGQVRRMEWITANLLDLSRLDAGLVQLNPRPVDLGELLEAAAAPFQQRMLERDIRLVVSKPEPPVTISLDAARMEMALNNLLDNALKFSPPGSQVTLQGEESEGRVRISVTDQGAGIPAEDLAHIFERFYRGKTSQAGSGLGLAIVHSIVHAHGGTVEVESQPGQGTHFVIAL